MDPSVFVTHCFRIGAATAVAENGCMPDQMWKPGRWKPSAYRGLHQGLRAQQRAEARRLTCFSLSVDSCTKDPGSVDHGSFLSFSGRTYGRRISGAASSCGVRGRG
ncbi:hypothetical protein FKM82_026956 [Ascaphus truei]